jgi:CheY-like chemotaxis protein
MTPPTYDSGGLAILVVDDDPVMLRMMEAMLRSDRHEVGLVGESAKVVEKFTSRPWDVVLTDLNMPGLDGEQIAQKIKALTPSTAVVLMTGFSRSEDYMGVDAVVHKPFKPTTIAAAINRGLAAVRANG